MEWPKITKDSPIEEAKRTHQQIWDYVIEHGKKPKTPYASDCAACEYDDLYYRGCSSCPIIWPDKNKLHGCLFGGLYTKWKAAAGEEKTELARQIRDLPWKFEIVKNTPL